MGRRSCRGADGSAALYSAPSQRRGADADNEAGSARDSAGGHGLAPHAADGAGRGKVPFDVRIRRAKPGQRPTRRIQLRDPQAGVGGRGDGQPRPGARRVGHEEAPGRRQCAAEPWERVGQAQRSLAHAREGEQDAEWDQRRDGVRALATAVQ